MQKETAYVQFQIKWELLLTGLQENPATYTEVRKIPLQIKTLRSNFSGELSSINQDGKKTKVALIMHVLKSGKCGKS